MPSLSTLYLRGFSIKGDVRNCILHESVRALAAGCPSCVFIESSPPLRFEAFPALQQLRSVFGVRRRLTLPEHGTCLSSLKVLECMSISGADMEDTSCQDHECMPLRRMLAVAELCMKAGAPLQSLRLAQCTAWGPPSIAGYADMVTTEAQAAQAYGPLSSCLHGLTELDLSASPLCGEIAVNAMVAAAPSLTSLAVCIKQPFERSTSAVHAAVHCRRVMCTNLQNLRVRFAASSHPGHGHTYVQVDLRLEDTSSLCSCVLDVNGDAWRKTSLWVSLREAASMDASVESNSSGWLLSIVRRPPEAAARQAVGTVRCFPGTQDGWHAEPHFTVSERHRLAGYHFAAEFDLFA
jgi:hypothetical protein